MSALPSPPGPGSPLPPPPSPRGGKRWRFAAIASATVIAMVAAVAVLTDAERQAGQLTPHPTSGASSAFSPPGASLESSPPQLATVPAAGFPDGWVTVSATDGSFTVSGPGPGTIAAGEHETWSVDMHEWTGGSCVLYLYRTGPESSPIEYTKGRLLSWVAEMDPHDRPTKVQLGTAVGWRTRLNYEGGQYPVGAFQVVHADDWEYSMGCGLSFTHPKRADRLVIRLLDSFSSG